MTFFGVDKRVVSKRVVSADVPQERKPERGYVSPKPTFYETALLSPSETYENRIVLGVFFWHFRAIFRSPAVGEIWMLGWCLWPIWGFVAFRALWLGPRIFNEFTPSLLYSIETTLDFLKFQRAQPSARLSEEICLSGGSQGPLRGLFGGSAGSPRDSAGVCGGPRDFPRVVTLSF